MAVDVGNVRKMSEQERSDIQTEIDGWRIVDGKLHATFMTGDFLSGAEFVAGITELAEAANHHPEVDLRYGSVHVSMISHDVGKLTQRDTALANQISQLAQQLDLTVDVKKPRVVTVGIDAIDIPAVLPFWKAVAGYKQAGDDMLVDPNDIQPPIWFQQMDAPRPQRNRIHLDVHVAADVAKDRVDAALAAGGHLINEDHAPSFWVLGDAEGNEACVCTWQS